MEKKITEVVAALIWDGDRFMICQRPRTKARGLLWEFVGGKVEPGETGEQALIRECREELAVTVAVGDLYMQLVHEYPDITIRLSLYHATVAEGVPQLLEHEDIRWILPSEIDSFEFCPADTEILGKIQKDAKEKSIMDGVQKVCNFLKAAEVYYLATEEGEQPRVRPFGTAHIYNGKLYVQTGKRKHVSAQLKKNPKAEICAFKDGTWLRLAGELVEDDSRDARVSMLDAYPELRGMYDPDDGNTQVLYFKNAEATFSSFTAPTETVRF